MLRDHILERGITEERDFRWRGGDVSRIEGFSDAVFAFALTLLVISLEVPQTVTDLMHAMRGFLAFGMTFAILSSIWYGHYIFFRRYALKDGFIMFVNLVLLFVILFYIYPLKFMFAVLVDHFFWVGLWGLPPAVNASLLDSSIPSLMIVFSLGFVLIFLLLFAFYAHALRRREDLGLNPLEVLLTRSSMGAFALCAGTGVVSLSLVLAGMAMQSVWSAAAGGIVYWFLGPLQWVYGRRTAKRMSALRKSLSAAAAAADPAGATPAE